MTRIALVVSDVDGTLLTKEKLLTERAIAAVRALHKAGIGFTITSSRPTIGMRFLIEPLGITLPIGAFNGSCIVDPTLKPIEQHLIPEAAARRAIEVLDEFGTDIWLFTTDRWLVRNVNGAYVEHESRTIRADPTLVDDFTPYLSQACKVVGASTDADGLQRCETAMQQALGVQANAIRSQSYYLDITPPGVNKGTFVQAMARLVGISTDLVATVGDMANDLAMFDVSGTSFAMGNATDQVKGRATYVTTSNEEDGFAKAIEAILGDKRLIAVQRGLDPSILP
jgi:Cof subfamily protein (haloacid dehalogenase superfamily)